MNTSTLRRPERRMNFVFWWDRFVPIQGATEQAGPSIDGDTRMFETFGPDMDRVQAEAKANIRKVWTVIEGDRGTMVIVPGLHWVNRLGFFVTEKEWEDEDREVLVG